MSNTQENIKKIQSLLKGNNLNQILLDRTIQTKWTFDKSKDYKIRELRISDDGKIYAWQGYGYRFQNTLQYLEDFDDYTISQVAKELEHTISLLKTYSVKLTGYVDVLATKAEYAKEYLSLHPEDAKKNLYHIELTNEITEIENN